MDHFELKDGVLHAEDVPLPRIAEEVGTPVYIYSRATLARHARVFREALAGVDNPHIAFAVKANPNLAVLKILASEGYGADVVSGGELARALAAGMKPADIVFSGVGKTHAELVQGLEADIGQFNIESEEEGYELAAIAARHGKRAACALRVNPDVDARTHEKISTGKRENKFGVPLDRAADIYGRLAQEDGLDMRGVAVHIGSQLSTLEPLETAFGKVGALIAELRAAGCTVTHADLGGGLGVPYKAGENLPSPAEYGAMVARVTRDWGVQLMFEPGRVIAGNAGVLLTQVEYLKHTEHKDFAIIDAAMNDLIRPALYQAWMDVSAVQPRAGEARNYDLVGPICETGDFLAKDRQLVLAEGDLLAVRSAGAYGFVMSSNYNTRGRAAEVLVDGEQAFEVRRRETVQELYAGESLLPA